MEIDELDDSAKTLNEDIVKTKTSINRLKLEIKTTDAFLSKVALANEKADKICESRIKTYEVC